MNDIDYDAYLANDRTLDDPEVVQVEPGGRVRLRIINGATATAFTIDLGDIVGNLIAVDGQDVSPVAGFRFPVAMGQRLDIRLHLPGEKHAFPILALREGARERTGIILAQTSAQVRKLASRGEKTGPVVDLVLEQKLRAAKPLASRSANERFEIELTGKAQSYEWALETRPNLVARHGERLEVTMINHSVISHPMHLHGHYFQVITSRSSLLTRTGFLEPCATRCTFHRAVQSRSLSTPRTPANGRFIVTIFITWRPV